MAAQVAVLTELSWPEGAASGEHPAQLPVRILLLSALSLYNCTAA